MQNEIYFSHYETIWQDVKRTEKKRKKISGDFFLFTQNQNWCRIIYKSRLVFPLLFGKISYITLTLFTFSDKNSIWVQIIQIYYLVCANKILLKISSLYISAILPADPDLAELEFYSESLQIIAQPCHTSKLRYRSDYEKNKNRRGVLRSRNNPNYKSPSIRVNLFYYSSTFSITKQIIYYF